MLQRFAILLSTAALVIAVACAQSDAGITTAVKAKLAADANVKAYQIDVDTDNGIVTLSGTVATPVAKEQAVMIARQSDGVRDVVVEITVSPEAAPTAGEIIKEEVDEAAREARDRARDAKATAGDAVDRAGAVLTDVAITSSVKAKLLGDTAVSGLKIDVDTKDGVVTLNGTVATRAEADRAVSRARETNGVKRVINNLRIGR